MSSSIPEEEDVNHDPSSNSNPRLIANSDQRSSPNLTLFPFLQFSGAIEEVVNNSSQDCRRETLTSNSEADSSSNGNKERMNSNNGIEGAKNEGTTSTSNMSTKLLSYFQLKPKKEKPKPQEVEGFKSLLTCSSSSTNKLESSVIRRIREDEVTKDFQQAKQYKAFLLRSGDQIVG